MSEIKISNISNRAGTSGAVIVGVTSSIGTGSARLASGDNSERVGIESGSIRYNETAKLLEFYDGETWNFIIPAEESANALGVFGGYFAGVYSMQYITIATTGNSLDFGTIAGEQLFRGGSCSSTTRGIFGGGYGNTPTGFTNAINYITIATKGNTTDFGDFIQEARNGLAACSSNTRGVFGGGWNSFSGGYQNVIEYITIATTGNSTDFGTLSFYPWGVASCSSSTRGIFAGGQAGPSYNNIEYITIATTGNATDFGDLLQPTSMLSGCSSSTRGVFGGGNNTDVFIDTIQYITIATTGNSQDFGDLIGARNLHGSCSSSTRGVFAGDNQGSTGTINTIEYITITTTGNGAYFGDLSTSYFTGNAVSNNHGGLL